MPFKMYTRTTRQHHLGADASFLINKTSPSLRIGKSALETIDKMGLNYEHLERINFYYDEDAGIIALKKCSDGTLNIRRPDKGTRKDSIVISAKDLVDKLNVRPGYYKLHEPRENEKEFDVIFSLMDHQLKLAC